MVWPENLIEELAYRRCIIFIGAGISATAKNASGETPVIWEDFLKKAVSLFMMYLKNLTLVFQMCMKQ